MNKICVFTQTYGNSREELFYYKSKDTNFIKFIDLFENSIFSFHNSDENYRQEMVKYKIPYREIIYFDSMNYTETIRNILKILEEKNFTHLLFLQDDAFSVQDDYSYYENLYKFLLNNKMDMINLFIESNNKTKKHKNIFSDIYLYETTNYDLVNEYNGFLWYADDSPCCASLSFLKTFYDKEYFLKGDIWAAEGYLNNKYKKQEYDRFTFNKCFFKNVNILGKNTHDRIGGLNFLNKKIKFC